MSSLKLLTHSGESAQVTMSSWIFEWRVSDAARAAFEDTDLCAEFGRNLAMELQDPSYGWISKMGRSTSRMTCNDGCLQRCAHRDVRIGTKVGGLKS